MNDLMGMNLDDLALFAHVVAAGGFTAAARVTGVPQATISRRVAALERNLGVSLLARTTRVVAVTDAGQRVYDHARRMLDECEGALAAAALMRSEPAGLIRIAAPVVLGQHLLAPAIASFLVTHPKIRIQVDLGGRLVDLVEEGFDLAVRVGHLPDSSLIQTRLMQVDAAYYAAPEVARGLKEVDDLATVPWLHAGNRSGPVEWTAAPVDGDAPHRLFRAEPRMTSSDVEVLIAAARAGLGVAVLPAFAAAEGLERVLPGWRSRRVDISALAVSHKMSVPGVRALIDHLKQVLGR